MAQNETYQDIKNLAYLTLTDINVPTNTWTGNDSFPDIARIYPWQAIISNSKITKDMIPEVIFNISTLKSCPIAPIAQTVAGGVIIYSKSRPSATSITIPTIICYSSKGGNLIT